MSRRTGIAIAIFIIAVSVAIGTAVRKRAAPPFPQSDWAVDVDGVAIGWPTTYSPELKACMARFMPGMVATRPHPREAAYAECTAKGR
jgi:hypothetical protein